MRQAAYDERHDPRMKATKHRRTAVARLTAWVPRYKPPSGSMNSTQVITDPRAQETQPTTSMQVEQSSEPSKTMSVSLANLGAGGGRECEQAEAEPLLTSLFSLPAFSDSEYWGKTSNGPSGICNPEKLIQLWRDIQNNMLDL